MVLHIYVGSYTNEIFTIAFDPEAPSLTLVSTLTVGFHPSWLTPHSSDPSVIFAGIEQTDGQIVAVKYDETGRGNLLGRTSSGGGCPCSLVTTDTEMLVGNVRVFGISHTIYSILVFITVRIWHVCRNPVIN